MSCGKGSVGITFEKLLNIESNEFEVPDFNAVIELKTKASFFKDKFPITLFSATCDGENLFELQRIREKHGVPVKEFNERVLFISLYGNKYSSIGKFKKGKLHVDYNDEKVYFLIENQYGKIIDSSAYWSFDLLHNKLYRKLKYLAFVDVDRKMVNKKLYFKYNSLTIYSLKDFKTFLNLLDNGYISINIKIGIYKFGPRVGQVHDHGTGFQILFSDLDNLFDIK